MKIFWSYARRDDRPPHTMVSNLRQGFEIELSQATGKDCEVYFNGISFRWGVVWRQEIDRLIRKSEALVAVVTPSFFNSRMCIYELQTALAESRKILPIYFRECKVLGSTFKEDGKEAAINKQLNKASRSLKEIQMKNFYPLLFEDYSSPPVRTFIGNMVSEII